MQQFRGFQAIVAAIVVSMAMLAGCDGQRPEDAVREQVASLQAAIDARDARAVEELLAEDFVGNEGIDRRGAKQLAAAVFLRYRDVAAKVGPVTVEMRGSDDAIARFSVLATGGSGGLLPEQGQVYRFETGWRLVDGDWRLVNASWTPPGLGI